MNRRVRTIVHLSLGLGMLAVVVAAGLSPNAGVVQASSNCTYGHCTSPSTFPYWLVGASVAAVVVALLLALLLLRRRRRPGEPPSEWEGPRGPGGVPPGATGPEGPGSVETAAIGAAAMTAAGAGEEPMWKEEAPGETPAEPSAGPSTEAPAEYAETPPAPSPTPSAAAPPEPSSAVAASSVPLAAAAALPAEEAEPDIDSLMAELEKISGEILKQKPKKKNGPPSSGASDDASP
jgi:uncharacterized membrane protein